MPESWLSVHRCQIEIRRQSYGGERKSGFISLPGREGTQQASTSRTVPPHWGIGRGYIGRGSGHRYVIRIRAVTVLHSSAKFQEGGVADRIRLCAGSQVVRFPNLDELLWSLLILPQVVSWLLLP